MASTPKRSPARKARGNTSPALKASPGPCPYKGLELVVPGDVFQVPDTVYKATVRGWNGRSTDSLVVKFDDGSQYWFPLEDALRWSSKAQTTADSAVADDHKAQLSPASGEKTYYLRRRSLTPATAAKSRSPADADNTLTPESSAKKPALRATRQQLSQQQQEPLQQQVHDNVQVTKWASVSVAGALAGVVLLLVVMLLAITAAKGAAHDLVSVLDSFGQLYSRVGSGARHNVDLGSSASPLETA